MPHCLLWLGIQKVKNLLVVKLNVLTGNSNFVVRILLPFNSHAFEKIPYSLRNYTVISFTNNWLNTLASSLLVFIAFHCVCLSTACLTVDKNRCVEAQYNLFYQVIDPWSFINDLLVTLTVKYLIKGKLFKLAALRNLTICRYSYSCLINYLK